MRLVLCALMVILCAYPALAHLDPGIDVVVMTNAIRSCSDAQGERVDCLRRFCEPGPSCAAGLVAAATQMEGPVSGIAMVKDVMSWPQFGISSDGHELAHIVGRETAAHSNVSGEAFLACPSEFNYGCQHGFFEYVLGIANYTLESAGTICQNLPDYLPPKDTFYCYHGMGHGVMMSVDYDLMYALEVCDSLPGFTAQEGCWQGAFMENVNGQMRSEVRPGIFLADDPLAPCNRVEEKYQGQCYENHGGYLVGFFRGSLGAASRACLNASPMQVSHCLTSLGLMTTNPGWQMGLGARGPDFFENAIQLCDQFPPGRIADCYRAGLSNYMNFQDSAEGAKYCLATPDWFKSECFGNMGFLLTDLVPPGQKEAECQKVPEEYFAICTGEVSYVRASEPIVPVVEEIPEKKKGMFDALKEFLADFWERARYKHTVAEVKVAQSRPPIPEDDYRLMIDDAFLEEAVSNYDLASVTTALSNAAESRGENCHARAHVLGRTAYKTLGNEAFKECGIECHSGCVHGATEAFFADKGTENLQDELGLLCSGQPSGFATHQCLHGIGHGLMAWSDYDLYGALDACNLLASQSARSSCYTGTFMENIVGAFAEANGDVDGHYSEYLSDDPHFPCNVVGPEYQPACYLLQTSRMIQIFGNDFPRMAAVCANASYAGRLSCFLSMGRDASGSSNRNAQAIIAACGVVIDPNDMTNCFNGAIQDQLWDVSQADQAFALCEALRVRNLSDMCYGLLIGRAGDVILDPSQRAGFCARMPESFRDACNGQKSSTFVLEDGTTIAPSGGPPVKSSIIVYNQGKYAPQHVTVQLGGSVTFVNNDTRDFWPASNIHPTHEIYSEFDPKRPLDPGTNWSFTFTQEGIWRFHDHLFPRATGSVTVSG